MEKHARTDYSSFDRPEVLQYLFHPRPDVSRTKPPDNTTDFHIPVEADTTVHARFHSCDKAAPTILFFHGNGEIVSDYDDLGPLYGRIGYNFFPVDYRGYGQSNGRPTVTGLMNDAHAVFQFVTQWLADNGHGGPLMVMGRSLGSASALELAEQYEDKIHGLIIESGFAFSIPLLRLLGVHTDLLGIREEACFNNLDKIKAFHGPTLIIHAEYDHIIPFEDGQVLFDACPASSKNLLKIPGADHNSIFSHGMEAYMQAIQALAEQITL